MVLSSSHRLIFTHKIENSVRGVKESTKVYANLLPVFNSLQSKFFIDLYIFMEILWFAWREKSIVRPRATVSREK